LEQPVRPHGVNTACNGVPSIRRGPWKLILERDAAADSDVQLYNLDTDLGEKSNVAPANPVLVAELRSVLETVIVNGRSTPGLAQKNDVPVRRYPLPVAAAAQKAAKAKKSK
jgi:hypothetical protein